MPPSWFSEIDHTGDVGVALSAPDLKTLFERAAWALFAVLTDPEAIERTDQWVIDVEGADRDDLLVRWLSELNFTHVTERIVLASFHIMEMTDRQLSAVVYGEPIDATRHVIHTEVKAVTYHALHVEKCADGWRAQVIFDM